MIFVPRIRGKVGMAEPGQGVDGKFFFTIWITDLYGKNPSDPIGPLGPFDTEEIALRELKEACKLACEAIEKRIGTGETSGSYLDMLNGGVLRKWQEH